MHIGIAGLISLDLLRDLVADGTAMPAGNASPFLAALVREYVRRGVNVSVFTHAGVVAAGDDARQSGDWRSQAGSSGDGRSQAGSSGDGRSQGHNGAATPLGTPISRLARVFRGDRLTVHVAPFRPSAAARALDLFARERAGLARAMREDPCDVVHAHWTYEFALAALDSGQPTLVTPRDWAPAILLMQRRPRSLAYRFARLLMNRRVLRRARWVTAASPYMLDLLHRHGHPGAVLVPNGIEDALLVAGPRPGPSAAGRIVSLNNGFQHLKNVTTLLRAFALLHGEGRAASLALAGRQFERGGPAEAWARHNGLADGVEFLGRLDRAGTVALLDRADLLAHPSFEESFGNTLLEAMARATPVLGGERSGAVPWVLDEGRAGVLCDVRAPQAIALAAQSVLADAGRWRSLSAAGLSRVRGTFTMSRVADAYLAEYERVMHEG